MAFTYDAVSWIASLGEWREWQRAALKHLNVQPDAHVLELAWHGKFTARSSSGGTRIHCAGFQPFHGQCCTTKAGAPQHSASIGTGARSGSSLCRCVLSRDSFNVPDKLCF